MMNLSTNQYLKLPTLCFLVAWTLPVAANPGSAVRCDFNGDDHHDLAIGAPSETIGSKPAAGSVLTLSWGRTVVYPRYITFRGNIMNARKRTYFDYFKDIAIGSLLLTLSTAANAVDIVEMRKKYKTISMKL